MQLNYLLFIFKKIYLKKLLPCNFYYFKFTNKNTLNTKFKNIDI